MTEFDGAPGVVAVGASAGGVEALTRLPAGLTPDLPYAVLIVLARILSRAGPLPANAVEGGGHICPDRNGSLVTVGKGSCRCVVGHAWTAEALLRARDEEMESARWVALRSVQENNIADEAEHAVSVLSERLSAATRQSEHPGG